MPQFESQFEENLYQLRRDKLNQIAQIVRAQDPALSDAEAKYPNSFRFTHTIPELRALGVDRNGDPLDAETLAAAPIEAAIAGRVMAIRVQGKAGFAQLQQGGQQLQLYVRKDDVGEAAFSLYKLLDLGDHIGVAGSLMRTRTGELTLHVRSLAFLTKAMLALPDKWSGLEDVEIRYRQRYVDLFSNPEVREVFVKRAAVLRAVRRFFDERGYLEVETPMLHTIAGGAAARTFTTHHNAEDMDLTLRIAPELHLKRLVVGGLDRVYEINRNFRNEGIDRTHNPEFTMLEFYQAYANYHDLMDLTQELVTTVAMEVNGTTITQFNGVEIDLSNWTKLSMREAIIKFWPEAYGKVPSEEAFSDPDIFLDVLTDMLQGAKQNFDAVPTSADATALRKVRYDQWKAIEHIWWEHSKGELLGKSISEVFEFLAEPHLIQPTIIYDFPLAVSPLSKIKPNEPDWVERFEVYIGGMEVGNAFSELNDPDDQHRRFQAQIEERARGDQEAMAAIDEDYVRALGIGLPPTAGEGIGIDRLTMILTGSRTIRDVMLFPLMRPKAGPTDEPPGDPN